jgi:hypothetical protein
MALFAFSPQIIQEFAAVLLVLGGLFVWFLFTALKNAKTLKMTWKSFDFERFVPQNDDTRKKPNRRP